MSPTNRAMSIDVRNAPDLCKSWQRFGIPCKHRIALALGHADDGIPVPFQDNELRPIVSINDQHQYELQEEVDDGILAVSTGPDGSNDLGGGGNGDPPGSPSNQEFETFEQFSSHASEALAHVSTLTTQSIHQYKLALFTKVQDGELSSVDAMKYVNDTCAYLTNVTSSLHDNIIPFLPLDP